MKRSNIGLGVGIGVLLLFIIWDVVRQVRTGSGVNIETYMSGAVILLCLYSILRKPK